MRRQWSGLAYLCPFGSAAAEGSGVLGGHLQHLGVEVGEGVPSVSNSLFQGYHCRYDIRLVRFESKAGLGWMAWEHEIDNEPSNK